MLIIGRDRGHRARALGRAGAIHRVNPPALADSHRQQPRIIAPARPHIGHALARRDLKESKDFAWMSRLVARGVGLGAALIGERGGHAMRAGRLGHHQARHGAPRASGQPKRAQRAGKQTPHDVLPDAGKV